MKGLEVGDSLYCHTTIISTDNYFSMFESVVYFTAGEYYVISKANQVNHDIIMLYTNKIDGDDKKLSMRRWFKTDIKDDDYYYKKWFYSSVDIAEMCKLKLNKINEKHKSW